MFWECRGLSSIVIPESVTSIGEDAFVKCSSLVSIYFRGDAPKLDKRAFTDCSAKIYYLEGKNGWEESFGGRPTEKWINSPEKAAK